MENQTQSKAKSMSRHIEACRQSGLTVSEYCTQNGLVKSGYYYWLKKLNGENKSSGFAAVNITTNGALEITYPNGVQLSFSGAINAATLKALVCCI
jgi:hypothetical protein